MQESPSNAMRKWEEERDAVRAIVKRHDDERLWDNMQSKDVPQEIVDYVMTKFQEGYNAAQVRRFLSIRRGLDPSWRKIMAAVRGGARADVVGLFNRYLARNEKLASRLTMIIDKATDIEVDPDDPKSLKEYQKLLVTVGKEVSQGADAINRLQQATIKMGKDIGLFGEQDSGGKGGVTIVVQNHVPLPTPAEVKAHTQKRLADIEIQKAEAKIEQRKEEVS